MTKYEILSRLKGVKEVTARGELKHVFHCPAHNDTNASGWASTNEATGRTILHCSAGCLESEILSALGLEIKDTYPEKEEKKSKLEFIRTHYYHNEIGVIIAEKQILFDTVKGKKSPCWYQVKPDKSYVAQNQWGYPQAGLPKGFTKPIYNAHLLTMSAAFSGAERENVSCETANGDKSKRSVALSNAAEIYIAEGEKDADTLTAMGFLGTTTPDGAGAKWQKSWNKFFENRSVVILADNDEPGKNHAYKCANEILDVAKSVKVVLATDIDSAVKDKGDISDIVAVHGLEKSKSMLNFAVANAKRYEILVATHEDGAVTVIPTELRAKIGLGRYQIDEIGMSNLFADFHKGDLKFCPERNSWFNYNGKFWVRDHGGICATIAEYKAKNFSDVLIATSKTLANQDDAQKLYSFGRKLLLRCHRDNMLKDARQEFIFSVRNLDVKSDLLNVNNGSLNLKTLELQPHNPEDLITRLAPVSYVQGAVCERWLRFIDEVFEGDTELAKYMQKVCGYLLTGDTNLECLFVLYGKSTRNGKSTLVGTICKLIGDYAGTVNSDTIALKNMANSSSASEDMARLAGVRMASINELDKNFKMGESKVKTMVGGDRLTARFLHENSFEFTPQFKLIINTNHVPTLSDTTMFRSGRMRVIPFNKHFSEAQQDKSLKSKLMSDEALSGILNWCLEGLRLLRAEGLDAPQSVKLSVDEYEKQTDKIAQYIEANLKPNSTERIAGDLMYTNYSLWCRASGYYPLSKANFYDELRSRDFRIDNRARIASGVACNVIFGYEILPPEGFGEPSGAVSNQEPPVGY